MSAGEDQADVESVLAGDVSRFEGIVRRWQGPLVNLAYRFCRDRGRAEEMAQEAFLRAFRALGGWRGDAAFSTWLFAVAANVYRSELRRAPPTLVSLDCVAEPGDPRPPDGGLDDVDRVPRHGRRQRGAQPRASGRDGQGAAVARPGDPSRQAPPVLATPRLKEA